MGWFEDNQPPAQPTQGGGGSYDAMIAPWTRPFVAPKIQDDPGYQFAREQGLQGLEQRAAAKGTLRTGGTIKAEEQFATDLANQYYKDAYARALGEYGLDRENFYNNQDRPFGKEMRLADMGLNASQYGNNNASSYGQNAGDLMTQIGNANGAAAQAGGNAWGGAVNNIGQLGLLWAILRAQGKG
jgi:hypothetical protein